jgi:hypothetical protein
MYEESIMTKSITQYGCVMDEVNLSKYIIFMYGNIIMKYYTTVILH